MKLKGVLSILGENATGSLKRWSEAQKDVFKYLWSKVLYLRKKKQIDIWNSIFFHKERSSTVEKVVVGKQECFLF